LFPDLSTSFNYFPFKDAVIEELRRTNGDISAGESLKAADKKKHYASTSVSTSRI